MYQLTHPVGCLLICEDLPGFMLAAKLANGKSLETLRAFTWFLTPGGVSAILGWRYDSAFVECWRNDKHTPPQAPATPAGLL